MQRSIFDHPPSQKELTTLQRAVRQGDLQAVLKTLDKDFSENEITEEDWKVLKEADNNPIWIEEGIESYPHQYYDKRKYKYVSCEDHILPWNLLVEYQPYFQYKKFRRNVPEGSFAEITAAVKIHVINKALHQNHKLLEDIYKLVTKESFYKREFCYKQP